MSPIRYTYVQLANMYAPSWGYGGPVRLMFDYARWMSSASDVIIFSGDLHHDFLRMPTEEHQEDGLKIHRDHIYLPRLAKRSIYLVSPRMLIRAAWLIRRANGPVIVHFAEFRGLVPLYALLLKLAFANKVLLVHSAFGMLHDKPGFRRKIFDSLFMRALLKQIDLSLTQNRHEHETYERLVDIYGIDSKGKTVLLPLHIDGMPSQDHRFTEKGKDGQAVGQLRKHYNIPEDALVFIFLGRLHPEKGILRMIDAYLELSRAFPAKTLLLIVGRDDGFQSQVEIYIAEKQLQNHVQIVNDVYESRFDYYFLSDIFLGFPTIFEETMLASIEALACGTPIIVSREADIPFVEAERAGRVIDFHIATAVQTMLAFIQDLTGFQQRARGTARRHFQGAAASEHLIRLFQELIVVGQSHNLLPSANKVMEKAAPIGADE